MDIVSYKERTINHTKPVDVYRCLTRKGYIYSVRQFGKVVGHISEVILIDVSFHVSKSGKANAIKSGIRNVHATIRGHIKESVDTSHLLGSVSYYPFCEDNFKCNNINITECNILIINKSKLLAYI